MKLVRQLKSTDIVFRPKKPKYCRTIENEKICETQKNSDEVRLSQITLEEYYDLFPEILVLKKEEFFSSLERYVQINLAPSNTIFPNGTMQKKMKDIDNFYYSIDKEKIDKYLLKKIKSYKTLTDISFFVPHCSNSKALIHTCGEQFFIFGELEFLYCAKCNLIYKSDFLLAKCDICNKEFYTEIDENSEKNEINKEFKLATWTEYHCNAIVNDTIKCKNCKKNLYLNITNNKLYCFNCKIELNQKDIKWICIICNKEFYSEVKIYNRLEYKQISLSIKKALFNGIEAKPNYIPCCKISDNEINSYKFKHNKDCNGILYLGKLKDKKIVVCSKCHMYSSYDSYTWFCPICNQKFIIPNKIINEDITKKIFENRISNRYRRNVSSINNVFEISCDKNKNNLSNDLIIRTPEKSDTGLRKQIFSCRKRTSAGTKLELTNDKSIDNTQEIRISNKSSENVFITIQENQKVINKIFNYKNEQKNPVSSSKNEKFMNNKILISLSKNIQNIYPPQLLKQPCPDPSEFKYKYQKFINLPSMKKHTDIKYPYDKYDNIKENNVGKNDSKIVLSGRCSYLKNRILSNFKLSQRNARLNNQNYNLNKNRNNRCNISQDISSNNNHQQQPYIPELVISKNKPSRQLSVDNICVEEYQKKSSKNTPINKHQLNIDDYNIIKQIGQGSFGKIFEVEDKCHNHFAMKKLIVNSKKEVEIIQKEYDILFSLNVPDLIDIYGIENRKLDKTTYVVYVLMELALCDWEKEIIKRNADKNYYKEVELTNILKKLVFAFAQLQKNNVSHRDIKPQNILVCKDGLKISDFGEAKKMINKNDNTIKQTIRGTELYMSPILFRELRNKKMINKYTKHNTYKSDVFSLGYCFLLASSLNFQLIFGIRELTNMQCIRNIVLRKIGKKYSNGFWNVIFSMIEVDEKNRPDFIELEQKVKEL